MLSHERLWTRFLYYENDLGAKGCLEKAYKAFLPEEKLMPFVYQNTSKLGSFIKQSRAYFTAAHDSDVMVKPLLLYYGCNSLLKALIILKDPGYPKTTEVLQHGLTTRKRKKNQYLFYDDELKIQKHGLLPLFSSIWYKQPLTIHQKYRIIDLLGCLPTLQESYYLTHQKRTLIPLMLTKQKKDGFILSFCQKELNARQLDWNDLFRLIRYALIQRAHVEKLDKGLCCVVYPVDESSFNLLSIPQFTYELDNHLFFNYTSENVINHPLLVYLMILYILSMLCRYETDLWSDMLHTSDTGERFMIESFLSEAIYQFPAFVLKHLSS
jgi:hypothetical protein